MQIYVLKCSFARAFEFRPSQSGCTRVNTLASYVLGPYARSTELRLSDPPDKHDIFIKRYIYFNDNSIIVELDVRNDWKLLENMIENTRRYSFNLTDTHVYEFQK